MVTELATTSYVTSEPFEVAIESLRRALSDVDLRIVAELDIAEHIYEKLMVGMAPCRIVLVTGPPEVCGELVVDPRAAWATPLHIVVAARSSRAEFHLLRALPADIGPLDGSTLRVLHHLQARTAQALERIAMRSSLVS